MIIILIAILLVLGIIVFQDFSSRSIHWITLPPLFVGLFFFKIETVTFIDIFLNILFIFIIFASLILYLRFREKRWVNPTKAFFGWGDILFLFAITPSEDNRSFMFLFIGGTLFSLLLTLILRVATVKLDTIPYAGMFSIFLIGHLVYSFFNPQFSYYKLIN